MGHMAIFLTLNEDEGTPDETELYLVDVGFGGPNQAVPLPLKPGSIRKGPVNEYHRITLFSFPKRSIDKPEISYLPTSPAVDSLPKLGQEFCLECTTANSLQEAEAKTEWGVAYAFSLSEAYPDDYAFLHFAHCNLNVFLKDNFIGVIYTDQGDGDGDGESNKPPGKITILNETMRKRDAAGNAEVTIFKSEGERIRALDKVFGIANIPQDAEQVIQSRPMAFKA